MKEKFTLRNVIVWGAAFLAILFFCLSFTVTSNFTLLDSSKEYKYQFVNGIWSAKVLRGYLDGNFITEMTVEGKPFALPIVGLVLVLVTALGMIVISFFVKKDGLRKVLSIASGVIAIVGGIFMFFIGETAVRTFCYLVTGSLEHLAEVKSAYAALGSKWYSGALGTISGVIFILSGVSFGVSAFLPEKKLAK